MKKSPGTPRWKCPEPLWQILQTYIPTHNPSPLGGRPPVDPRKVVDGIFYVIRTGISWKDMPPCFASSSTCHRYFQRWNREGIFQLVWEQCLGHYDDDFGIDWKKLNIDSSQIKAPLGGEKNRSFTRGPRENWHEKVSAM